MRNDDSPSRAASRAQATTSHAEHSTRHRRQTPHLCPPHTMQSLSHSIARIPSLARSGMSLRRYDRGELLTIHPSPPARPMPPPLHLLDRTRLAPYVPFPPPHKPSTNTTQAPKATQEPRRKAVRKSTPAAQSAGRRSSGATTACD